MSKKEAPKITDETGILEEAFCIAFTTNDSEVFGNGVQSYLATYGLVYFNKHKRQMDYKVAGVLAHKLLKKVKIINRINELLETGGFNEQNVDKQHLFLLNQSADMPTKMKAIQEFNKLRKRIDNKLELVIPKPILSAVFNEVNKDALHSNIRDKEDTGSGE